MDTRVHLKSARVGTDSSRCKFPRDKQGWRLGVGGKSTGSLRGLENAKFVLASAARMNNKKGCK
jgi:hypothetical protein